MTPPPPHATTGPNTGSATTPTSISTASVDLLLQREPVEPLSGGLDARPIMLRASSSTSAGRHADPHGAGLRLVQRTDPLQDDRPVERRRCLRRLLGRPNADRAAPSRCRSRRAVARPPPSGATRPLARARPRSTRPPPPARRRRTTARAPRRARHMPYRDGARERDRRLLGIAVGGDAGCRAHAAPRGDRVRT